MLEAPGALAAAVGKIALHRFARGLAQDPIEIDANYVRRSDAELLWKDPWMAKGPAGGTENSVRDASEREDVLCGPGANGLARQGTEDDAARFILCDSAHAPLCRSFSNPSAPSRPMPVRITPTA